MKRLLLNWIYRKQGGLPEREILQFDLPMTWDALKHQIHFELWIRLTRNGRIASRAAAAGESMGDLPLVDSCLPERVLAWVFRP